MSLPKPTLLENIQLKLTVVKHSNLFCQAVSDKKDSFSSIFLGLFIFKKNDLKWLPLTNTLAYFDKISMIIYMAIHGN